MVNKIVQDLAKQEFKVPPYTVNHKTARQSAYYDLKMVNYKHFSHRYTAACGIDIDEPGNHTP
jgi:hypothetical protein